MKNTIDQHSRKIGFLFWILTGGVGLGLGISGLVNHGNGWMPLLIAIPVALLGIINSWPDKKTAHAIEVLQGCGLHGQYYDEVDKCAEGVREIILSLRADCNALVQNYNPISDLIYLIIRYEDDGDGRDQQSQAVAAYLELDMATEHAEKARARAVYILENDQEDATNEFDPKMRFRTGNPECIAYIVEPVTLFKFKP